MQVVKDTLIFVFQTAEMTGLEKLNVCNITVSCAEMEFPDSSSHC